MENKDKMEILFKRYLAGLCSPAEVKYLLEHFNIDGNEEQLKTIIRQTLYDADENNADNEHLKSLTDQTLFHIKKRLSQPGEEKEVKQLSLFRKMWVRVAAAVIIISAGAGLYFSGKSKSDLIVEVKTEHPAAKDVITPGGEKAILTLADGSTIILDSAATGELVQQGGTKVIKLDDGQLSYTVASKNTDEVLYNTMTTPRGGQYKLVLPDGSRVWLNAASSIRYPTSFKGYERRVEIAGEAYFEVTKDPARPFRVAVVPTANHKSNMEVEVVGTHFNINAYSEEPGIQTTLLEGSVKIKNQTPIGNRMIVLKPGQRSEVRGDNALSILVDDDIDIDEIMAWKNGNFLFNSSDIQTIMRQISRWYDVDISYQGKISKETFSGVVSRNSNISQVMKIMQEGGVKFNIEGKKIIVIQE